MQEVLKQLQSKLEQEAGTLASSGRSDVLHQLKGLIILFFFTVLQPCVMCLLPRKIYFQLFFI